jgi:hypothetical protein
MDDDALKQRVEETDRRISAADKRIDDLKGYLAGGATLLSIWFAVLTLVLGFNYNSDKASLRDFQKDLREDLGKSAANPELVLLGLDGQPLSGQELEAKFWPEQSGTKITLDFSIKNAGNGATGPLTVAVYTVDPIKLNLKSIDERDYKYEATIDPKYNEPSEIPGQYTSEWFLTSWMASKEIPPPGKYPALIKFYYGKGKVAGAKIIIRVPEPR